MMNPADKELLLARLDSGLLAAHAGPNGMPLANYRVYLNEVTDCWTFGGLVLDVCGSGDWICHPTDGKQPRWSKKGDWQYVRSESEAGVGYLQLVERYLDYEHLSTVMMTYTDWATCRHFVEQL